MRALLSLVGLLLFSSFCFAGSVRLINDSPHKLRAVIRANDGSNLGELVVEPDQATTWYDSAARTGVLQKGNLYQNQPSKSQTPYSVLWYCPDGSDYSLSEYVYSGNTVTAQTSAGARQCKLKKKKEQNEKQPDSQIEKDLKKQQRSVGPPKY